MKFAVIALIGAASAIKLSKPLIHPETGLAITTTGQHWYGQPPLALAQEEPAAPAKDAAAPAAPAALPAAAAAWSWHRSRSCWTVRGATRSSGDATSSFFVKSRENPAPPSME